MSWGDLITGLAVLTAIYAWLQAPGRRGRAVGTVFKIAYDAGRTGGGEAGWHPHVRFKVGEETYTFVPSVVTISDTRKKRVGAKVLVAYDPSDPRDADLASPWRMYFGPLLLSAGAAAILYLRSS